MTLWSTDSSEVQDQLMDGNVEMAHTVATMVESIPPAAATLARMIHVWDPTLAKHAEVSFTRKRIHLHPFSCQSPQGDEVVLFQP